MLPRDQLSQLAIGELPDCLLRVVDIHADLVVVLQDGGLPRLKLIPPHRKTKKLRNKHFSLCSFDVLSLSAISNGNRYVSGSPGPEPIPMKARVNNTL